MLWEIVTGIKDEFTVLIPNDDGIALKYFITNGEELVWPGTATVAPFVDPKRKKQKLRGDIEFLTWGAIVLNQRAWQALHAVLQPFGQFLPVDCQGQPHYFYNVTKLLAVVDYEHSGKTGTAVTKPVFLADATPRGFCIFKDKLTAKTAIYVNDETKITLEKLALENKLQGLYFIPAGCF
jgi:hypothetical protein